LIERGAQAVVTLLAEGLAAAQNRGHGEPGLEREPGEGFNHNQSD
jgi:hypothetical protein